jgi:hypothetical protein
VDGCRTNARTAVRRLEGREHETLHRLRPRQSLVQPAFRILLARTLAGKDSNGRHEPSRISRLGSGNPKHVSNAYPAQPLADSQWEEESPARREAAQPQRLGMSCSCVDKDHVAWTCVARSPVFFPNLCVGVGGQVGAGAGGKSGIDFNRRDVTVRSYNLRNDRRVVPNTAADMQYAIAGLDFQKTQESGKGGWVTIL